MLRTSSASAEHAEPVKPEAGQEMISVQTVSGPAGVADLGIVLPHEHLVSDLSRAYTPAPDAHVRDLLAAPTWAGV
jgi:hypothetical protein